MKILKEGSSNKALYTIKTREISGKSYIECFDEDGVQVCEGIFVKNQKELTTITIQFETLVTKLFKSYK